MKLYHNAPRLPKGQAGHRQAQVHVSKLSPCRPCSDHKDIIYLLMYSHVSLR